MGYALHTNSDVAIQLRAGSPNPLPVLLGQFVEKEFGHTFEYSARQWADEAFHPYLQHMIYTGNGERRLAHVMKTIAYVLTGEGDLQRWEIKRHRKYETDWIKG